MEFIISASTDIGTRKNVNQDSLFVRKLATKTGKMAFAVLCDGMGGLERGEVASASLITAFTDWMYTYLPVLSRKSLEDQVIKRQWQDIIVSQNEKIREYGERNHCSVGSTVTAMLLTEERYYLLNIGDSRAYEINETVRRLTEDHTVVANEVKLGNLTEEQAEESPMRHILTKCVGVKKTVYPDMFFGDTKRNSVYMLCSDGFRHNVTPQEMQAQLYQNVMVNGFGLKQQEVYLIDCNKQRGETDNISVITIAAK